MVATQLFVVPRSIPITLLIFLHFLSKDGDATVVIVIVIVSEVDADLSRGREVIIIA
jgi:hypothetical protein